MPLTACRCWDGPARLGSSGAGSESLSDSLASDMLSSKTKACFFGPTLGLCARVARGESGPVGMRFVLLGGAYHERILSHNNIMLIF